ncbi:hypothetical protein [Pseudomonas putida]|uniref:hypothetical protein n=1 Tax=Pseudomonas putida TaxID=303 RepID=UPI001C22824D|nr:hypothetical protein [Pseudomonas putida]
MTDKVLWKTLPTKANRDMELAGADAAREYLERTGSNSLYAIYEAMAAAAPAVPAGPHLSDPNALLRSAYNEIAEANGINGWCVCCREHVEDDGVITHDQSCTFCAIEMRLYAATKPSAPVQYDERAKFEAAYAEEFSKARGNDCSAEDIASMRDDTGGYGDRAYLNGQWKGWQARAALENKPC